MSVVSFYISFLFFGCHLKGPMLLNADKLFKWLQETAAIIIEYCDNPKLHLEVPIATEITLVVFD